jgi:tetratricopeptide (TPR) repeat protein
VPAIRKSTPRVAAFVLLMLAISAHHKVAAQVAVPGYPSAVTAYDPREVRRLPRYCIYTQSFRDSVQGGRDEAQISYWYSTLGEPFHSLHHYCWGLMKLNRALFLARNGQTRTFYFGSAIQEFDYVLERAPESFVLAPEILTKKGQALIRMGRGPAAVPILEKAIALKPDYWPPYVQLSEYYQASGQIGEAKEILQKAIEQSPGTESLKKRLAELEGSKSKPRADAK